MKLIPIAANQTEVQFHLNMYADDVRVFFSYKTPVAAWIDGRYVRTDKKWSVTTSRHINKWLAGAQADTVSQADIENLGQLAN